jgi:hypothetical protein
MNALKNALSAGVHIFIIIASFIARLNYVYRIIGLILIVFLVNKSIADIRFLLTYNKRKEFTLQELLTQKRDELPRYLVLKGAFPSGHGILTTNESGESKSVLYPVISLDDVTDSTKAKVAQVFLEKPGGNTESMSNDAIKDISGVEGRFDASKNIYRKERELFSRVGYSIPDDVIVITKSREFPSMYGVVKGLFFLILCFGLLIFSFLISLKSDLT